MAKIRSQHVCQSCGHVAMAWTGRCPDCGEWNTLVESVVPPKATAGKARAAASAASGKPVLLRDVVALETARYATGIGEFDRVLGGGIVPGSLVLLGGSPGIGKSTLTGMAMANLQASGIDTLYVSGEESASQVRLRAERLGPAALGVKALAENSLETILATVETEQPKVVVIDSIQTMHSADLTGAPGSVGQVREAAGKLAEIAKRLEVAVILVGHVTKEGSLAGPRVLEHLVDCVLQFEGERERTYRTLRAIKNRFGATSEVGVFEMRSGGLTEVTDPSARFVEEATGALGSVILTSMEGTRPVLVEVQALVSPSELEIPRRVVNGIDRNRLSMVLAVLSRHAGIGLGTSDVFVNVVGGVRVDEPGADLAVALAVVSAQKGEPLEGDGGRPLACFGELGLTGDLRFVGHADRRVAEAVKFGLGPVVGPRSSERIAGHNGCGSVREAVRTALGGSNRRMAA
ncbi:MAG: DNA repair protein RadA [Solirubrobacterales bacterium]